MMKVVFRLVRVGPDGRVIGNLEMPEGSVAFSEAGEVFTAGRRLEVVGLRTVAVYPREHSIILLLLGEKGSPTVLPQGFGPFGQQDRV